MIIDRYPRPTGVSMPMLSDPILQALDTLLDDPDLFKRVKRDLQHHYCRAQRGRRPVPVEVTLRLIVLRRHKRWSYRQAEQEVRDSPAYRGWTRVYAQAVPDHTTLNDLERVIQPETLHGLNDRLMRLASERDLTHGERLRVDSSVTESPIHYPTDSSLLVDGVGVLSRNLRRAKPLLKRHRHPPTLFRDRTRSARRRARRIGRLAQPRSPSEPGSGATEVKKSLETGLFRTD